MPIEDETSSMYKTYLEYRSFADVLNEVKAIMVIDLSHFPLAIDKPYQKCLKEDPAGVYICGQLDPILPFSPTHSWFTVNQYQKDPTKPDVVDFETFINANSPILDIQGKPVVPIAPVARKHAFFDHCQYNRSAIHMAMISIIGFLDRLHPATKSTSNKKKNFFDLSTYVKEEHLHPVEEGVLEFTEEGHLNQNLALVRVMDFVGNDIHHQYHVAINGPVLRISKGNDYRVIEYYNQIFKSLEEDHEKKRLYELS